VRQRRALPSISARGGDALWQEKKVMGDRDECQAAHGEKRTRQKKSRRLRDEMKGDMAWNGSIKKARFCTNWRTKKEVSRKENYRKGGARLAKKKKRAPRGNQFGRMWDFEKLPTHQRHLKDSSSRRSQRRPSMGGGKPPASQRLCGFRVARKRTVPQ